MTAIRMPDGTVMQSGLGQNPLNYSHERLNGLFVGIVLAVHYSDDPQNATAVTAADQRGSGPTCDVLITSSGNDNIWTVPNVLVLPEGPTGIDDFCESIPRACSGMIDGSQFQANMCIDYSKLDGDWCIVGFIGGSYSAPVMLKWWPHPGNRRDPATLGWPVQNPSTGPQDAGTLKQGRRMFRRFQGVKYTITKQGSVYFDTNEANSTLVGDKSGPTRQQTDEGGDIQIDVKPARQMQVNFNKAVPLPTDQPSLPQQNPPQGEYKRDTDRTTITLDKDTISMLAGKIIELLTSDDYIEVHAKTKVRLHGDDSSDTVILGDTDPANCDHTIKAETFRDQFYNMLVTAFNNHKHGTPVGPTSTPTPDPSPDGPIPAQTLGDSAITKFVKVKK